LKSTRLNEQGTYEVAVYPISRHTKDKLHTIASRSRSADPRKKEAICAIIIALGNGWASKSSYSKAYITCTF